MVYYIIGGCVYGFILFMVWCICRVTALADGRKAEMK